MQIAGVNVLSLDRKSRGSFRGNQLGFIFQDFNKIWDGALFSPHLNLYPKPPNPEALDLLSRKRICL